MIYKKPDIENFYKCVRSFRSLGTGRKSKRVLVGDSEDARTSHFSFVTNILHNWPSWNQVKFTNGRSFDISSQTVGGKHAYIFDWNELTEDLWSQQVERTRILEWLETAKPQDVIAIAELTVGQSESSRSICQHPDLASLLLQPIQIEIRKMSLPSEHAAKTFTLHSGLQRFER